MADVIVGKSVARYVRTSARKLRYVIEPLRNRTVREALGILATTNRRAARPLALAIASAYANARQQHPALAEDQMIIRRLIADGGPMWKRFRPAAFGRAAMIRKRTAHITVELSQRATQPAAPRPQPVAAMPPAVNPASRGGVKRPAPTRNRVGATATHGT